VLASPSLGRPARWNQLDARISVCSLEDLREASSCRIGKRWAQAFAKAANLQLTDTLRSENFSGRNKSSHKQEGVGKSRRPPTFDRTTERSLRRVGRLLLCTVSIGILNLNRPVVDRTRRET